MDPLDFLTEEEMSKFFHCKKTEISCIEEPQTFLNQLRDHNLVPDDLYKKVANMKSKERKQKGVYDILEWLEKERGECMKLFWSCVFQDHILKKYSIFRLLRKSFHDGSFRIYETVPNTAKPSRNKGVERKDKMLGEKKRKKNWEERDEEEPSPSSVTNQKKAKQVTSGSLGMHKKIPNTEKPSRNNEADRDKKKQKEKCVTKQKKSVKETAEQKTSTSSVSNQRKTVKKAKVCSFGMHKKIPNTEKPSRNKEVDRDKKKQKEKCVTKQKKSGKETAKQKPSTSSVSNQRKTVKKAKVSSLRKKEGLHVTCGDKEGILYPDKLDRAAKCIYSEGQWFTTSEFEKFSGKESYKNWKLSIRWRNTPLMKLLKDGHLQYPQKANKSGMK